MQMRTHCLTIVLSVVVLLFGVFCFYYFMSDLCLVHEVKAYVIHAQGLQGLQGLLVG